MIRGWYTNISRNGAIVQVLLLFMNFEVLTGVIVDGAILWYVTPRNLVEVSRRFGGTYCLNSYTVATSCVNHPTQYLL